MRYLLGAVICCGVFCAGALRAESASIQRVQFKNPDEILTFEFLDDALIHFDFSPAATSPSSPLPTTPFVARKKFVGVSSFFRQGQNLETSRARIEVDSSTLCFSVFDKARGQQSSKPLTRICPTPHTITGLSLDRMAMQDVYGLGEQFHDLGNANGDWIGKTRTPGGKYGNALPPFGGGYTGNAQFPVMYALGPDSLNYALYLDTVYPLSWDFTTSSWKVTRTLSGSDPSLRGYLMLGDDLPALRTSFMDLVGHPPVPPKKAFGLWVSEFGYRNWGEIRDKLGTLRWHGFPIDGFVLDVYWYGGYKPQSPDSEIGTLDWDTTNFPDPKETIADFRDNQGIGLMTIEQSYIGKNLGNFSEMASHGFLAREGCANCDPAINTGWWGQGGMIDWTDPAAGAYWHQEHREKVLTDFGITFHWTDLGEPELYNEDNYYSGIAGTGHTQADVHNAYNFLWHQSIDQGYKDSGEILRHFQLSRSGAPGIQRFGSAMWSGDIGSNLRSLSSHLNAQMQMSLSGIDYFGADVGGFHRQALEGDLNEVYTKWFAHAALFDVPVRPHTDDGSKKNETSPDRIGDLKSNLLNIRQRYELAPYYYTLAYRAWLWGEPVIPPLVYYYQNDPNVRIIADEKMIGRDLLAATAAQLGETDRGVYLPAGDWVDYHTNRWYHSTGQWFADFSLYPNGVFQLPLFARAGAIIPKAPVDDATMNILGMREDGIVKHTLIARVYASATPTDYKLFEDDGTTQRYLSGAYATTRISQQENPNSETVIVDPTQGSYDGAPSERQNIVEMVAENKTVWRVLWNERPLPFYSDPEDFEDAWEGWTVLDDGTVVVKSDFTDVTDSKNFEFDFR